MSKVCVLWILGFFGILTHLMFETKPEWQQAEPFPIANRTYNFEQRILFFPSQWQIQDFHEVGGAATSEKEAKTYYLARYLLKLHGHERNWTEGGVPSATPQSGSANASVKIRNILI